MLYEGWSAGSHEEKNSWNYFGLPSAFVDLSAFQDSIEFEASVLVDGGESVQIQMTGPGFVYSLQGVDGKREPQPGTGLQLCTQRSFAG